MTDPELLDVLDALVETGFKELVVTDEEYDRLVWMDWGDDPPADAWPHWRDVPVVSLSWVKQRALFQQRFRDRRGCSDLVDAPVTYKHKPEYEFWTVDRVADLLGSIEKTG